jgi:predicted PurR-regulated permease PerM
VLSKSLQLSPLAVILAILFCGWMWGISGGLMAAPLLTIVKIICDQFESLHGWSAVLAGASPKDAQPTPPVTARSPTAA